MEQQQIDRDAFNEAMRNLVAALNEAGSQFMRAVEVACADAGKSVQQLAKALAETQQRDPEP